MLIRLLKWLYPTEKDVDESEPIVMIHLLKNGFYADPEDIFSHPNVDKQLNSFEELLEKNDISLAKPPSGGGSVGPAR